MSTEPDAGRREPIPVPISAAEQLLRLQAAAGNRAVGHLIQRVQGGVTSVEEPVERAGELTQVIRTTGAGNFTVKTSIQKHCVASYRVSRRVTTAPSGRAVNQNTIALVDRDDFVNAFSEYVEEVARRMTTQGDQFDPSNVANQFQTTRNLTFHSDSQAGIHTIHTYPVAGSVNVLDDSQFLMFKDVAYVLYGDPAAVGVPTLGKVHGNITVYLGMLGKTQQDYAAAVANVQRVAQEERAWTRAWAETYGRIGAVW